MNADANAAMPPCPAPRPQAGPAASPQARPVTTPEAGAAASAEAGSSPAHETILRGEALVRRYGGVPVASVDRIEVRSGEVLALLGPNGAGKSTLLRILAGLERPDAGRLVFRGREVRARDAELRRASACVFQRPYLWSGRVRDNVEFGLKARGVAPEERRRRTQAILDLLGIAALADAPVSTLSGGEARRVALARALVLEPQVLFLDEPTADLDVSIHRRFIEDVERAVRRSRRAVLLVTHLAPEAFALGDRIAVMECGRIVQEGTPEEIFEMPATEFAASFTGAEFLLRGRVRHAEGETVWVDLDTGGSLEARGRVATGAAVRVAYRPEDVVITVSGVEARSSARNRFEMRIAAARAYGSFVRLRLTGPGLTLVALITRHAMEDLGLRVSSIVTAQVKATALHTFETF
ncbi:MAG: ABC transporter ATP-binding protein [Gemmatimonadetes bacterium]|nr:ABC transporter ATP-binding protein [Gemmatimonadota bacterium]